MRDPQKPCSFCKNPHLDLDAPERYQPICRDCYKDIDDIAWGRDENPRDTTEEDERAAFNDRLEMFRAEH